MEQGGLPIEQGFEGRVARGIEVTPGGADGDCCAYLGGAAGGDAVVMRLVLAGALRALGDVENGAAGRPTNLIGERAISNGELLRRRRAVRERPRAKPEVR